MTKAGETEDNLVTKSPPYLMEIKTALVKY